MEKLNPYIMEECQRAGPWQGNVWTGLCSKTKSSGEAFTSLGASLVGCEQSKYHLQERGKWQVFLLSVIGGTKPTGGGVLCGILRLALLPRPSLCKQACYK